MKKKKLKQNNACAHLVWYRFKIRGGSPEGKGSPAQQMEYYFQEENS